MLKDFLKEQPVEAVAGWYRRLAHLWMASTPDLQISLAGVFLRQWLDNRKPDATYYYDAPSHVRTAKVVRDVQSFHRNVFLTYEKGRFKNGERFVGILPRLQGRPGFAKWDMRSELQLEYESLCDIAPNIWDINRIQHTGTTGERDIMGSLRGFQLKSKAVAVGRQKGNIAVIRFTNWQCTGKDRYDWNYREFLTVPNPDYKSTASYALEADEQSVTVWHSNAERLEKAKLACPYDLVLRPWEITDTKLLGDSAVDVTVKL